MFAGGGFCPCAGKARVNRSAAQKESAGRVRMETFINAPASENCSVTRTENFKIRTATTIHPNAITVIAPSAVLRAGAAAALHDEAYAPASFGGAIVAITFIGGAVDGITVVPTVPRSTADLKFGAAAAVNPKAAAINAPTLALDTRRLADLALERDLVVVVVATVFAVAIV